MVVTTTICLLTLIFNSARSVVASTQRYEELTITTPPSRRVIPARASYVAACVVAKNPNSDDLMEWLVHHLSLGMGHVYWYDHNSTEDISRVVAPFEQAGLLTLLRPIGDPTYPVQLPVYHHCGDMYGARHDWLAFIDADEMLWLPWVQKDALLHDEQPLVTLLKEYEAYAGLSVNWVMYGTSGHVTRPHDTTLRAYSRCMTGSTNELAAMHQRHVKTIVHTARLHTPFRFYHPHGGHFVHDLVPVEPDQEMRVRAQKGPFVDEQFRPLPEAHITESHTAERIALLHFITRSKEEAEAKVARGAADGTRKGANLVDHIDELCEGDCSLVIEEDHHERVLLHSEI